MCHAEISVSGKRIKCGARPSFVIDSPDIRKTARFYVKRFHFGATYHIADENFTNPHIHLRRKHNVEILLKPWNNSGVYGHDRSHVLSLFRKHLECHRACGAIFSHPFGADLFFECNDLDENIKYLKKLGHVVKVYRSYHVVEDIDGRQIVFLERKKESLGNNFVVS